MMKRFYEFICRQEMQIAKYSLGILSLLVFVAAVARTLHYPLNWAMDAATFLFAWTVFLGADAAMRMDRLFCIEVVTSKLSPKAQLYLKIINYMIIAVFLAGMIGYGLSLSFPTRRASEPFRGFQVSAIRGLRSVCRSVAR
jgi:TRAP-type C4-dicarboxylate transport system permease small subunit